MTPNINNNLLDIPLGLSVYANCIDVLKSIDLAYDGAKVAMEIGRPRIGVTNNGLIANVIEGRTYNAFDANDISIYDIGSGSKDEKVVIEDLTTPYRATEFEQSLQTQLDIFSQAIGLGDKAFKWQQGSVPTATQVISENSSMLRTMEKHQINVERAIKELIVGILDINGSNTDVDIDIKFDDSVTRAKTPNAHASGSLFLPVSFHSGNT
jgi:A118 family predicted phage portal protein